MKCVAAVAIALVATLIFVAPRKEVGRCEPHQESVAEDLEAGFGRVLPFEWTILAEERPSPFSSAIASASRWGCAALSAVLPNGDSMWPATAVLNVVR